MLLLVTKWIFLIAFFMPKWNNSSEEIEVVAFSGAQPQCHCSEFTIISSTISEIHFSIEDKHKTPVRWKKYFTA